MQAYDLSLASLLASDAALSPVVTILERATPPQLDTLLQLLQRTVAPAGEGMEA